MHAGVFNENEVRAAAGMTMVMGAVVFVLALTEQIYLPLQLMTIFFFIEFGIRVTAGLQYSPLGRLAHVLVRRHEPEWVSARPKRFAWSMGVVLSFAMVIITNYGHPRRAARDPLLDLPGADVDGVRAWPLRRLRDLRLPAASRLDRARTTRSRSAPAASARHPGRAPAAIEP